MKLSEKILYYRRRNGLSQEALAEQLGVSRQAVSKWETGEAMPEVMKLSAMAKLFGITVDELLNEEEPAEQPPQPAQSSSWIDAVPGFIGRLLRKYGWLFGVYTAVTGFIFTIMGAAARGISNAMMNSFNDSVGGRFSGGEIWYDEAGSLVDSIQFGEMSAPAMVNPVAILGTIIMILGLVMLAAGIVLAIVLKKRAKQQ